ncbi:MAG: heme ABC transporter permease CcmC [Myxococcota bacterium]
MSPPAPTRWSRYAAPAYFYPLAGRLIPWFAIPATLLAVVGLVLGLYIAPPDFRQGDAYRIIFVHVPAAWMSLWLYLCMAFYAGLGLVFRTRLSSMMATALAPTGALFTFLALWTGSLWGRPVWGTWWAWDARMTSELVLLFLYLGVMALRAAIDDPRRADRATGLLALVGVVNVPIIFFSVRWWNTLHQGASISVSGPQRMAQVMLTAMLIMTLAFWLHSFVTVLLRVRCVILERERHTEWVRDLLGDAS